MAAKSLQELFVEELRDTYDAEKRLTKALPKMAKAATSPELKTAFTNHLRETEEQIDRLEQVFQSISEPVRGKKCDGIMGIIEESNTAISELDEGPILDAALIAGAQRAEHYEIAAYGTLAYFAELLGEDEAKNLLGETLDEEKATDEKLTVLAKAKVNREALLGVGAEEGDEEQESFAMRARRSASSMAMANDRSGTGGRSSSRGSGSSRSRSTSSRGGSSSRRRTSAKKR